jgi:phage head maturation protease
MSDAPAGVALDATRETPRAPKENLVRAASGGVTLRAVAAPADDQAASENANGMPTLYGHFTPFNTWSEINSMWEGNFMERIAPKAFAKTFRERIPAVLFQHGGDPQIGDKPLGAPEVLREDDFGPYYEVPMLDTAYNREIIPGLEAGVYGASFRFSVMREEWVDEPGTSEHNPKGLPERTLKEVRCQEFGPVSFPQYPEATAGVRSMTDEYLIARATSQPDTLRSILEYLEKRDARTDAHALAGMISAATGTDLTPATEPGKQNQQDTPAPSQPDAAQTRTSAQERRDPNQGRYGLTPKDQRPSWALN